MQTNNKDSKVSYTKGEWDLKIDQQMYYFIDSVETGQNIASVMKEYISMDKREAKANAKLIAAAPDLLEALHTFCDLRTAQWNDPLLNAYHKAKQAIKKATEQ